MTADETNGRVTTREFYTALLDIRKEQGEMERRLGSKIDDLAKGLEGVPQKTGENERRLNEHHDKIEKLETANTRWGALALIISTSVSGAISWLKGS